MADQPNGTGSRRRGIAGRRRTTGACGRLLTLATRPARTCAARWLAAGFGAVLADVRAGGLASAPHAVRRRRVHEPCQRRLGRAWGQRALVGPGARAAGAGLYRPGASARAALPRRHAGSLLRRGRADAYERGTNDRFAHDRALGAAAADSWHARNHAGLPSRPAGLAARRQPATCRDAWTSGRRSAVGSLGSGSARPDGAQLAGARPHADTVGWPVPDRRGPLARLGTALVRLGTASCRHCAGAGRWAANFERSESRDARHGHADRNLDFPGFAAPQSNLGDGCAWECAADRRAVAPAPEPARGARGLGRARPDIRGKLPDRRIAAQANERALLELAGGWLGRAGRYVYPADRARQPRNRRHCAGVARDGRARACGGGCAGWGALARGLAGIRGRGATGIRDTAGG